MRLSWLALIVAGCASTAKPAYVRYQDADGAYALRLSASGAMAAIEVSSGGKHAVRLRQRAPDERQVASGAGVIVGVPSERDVLVVDRGRIRWLSEGRGAELDLPRDATFVAGTVDHAKSNATLAFASRRTHTMRVISIDAASLEPRGVHDIGVSKPESCRAAGHRSTLYVWCDDTDDVDIERWKVWRYEGSTPVWQTAIEYREGPGRHEVRGAVTGDGSALVLLHGGAETSRMRFHPTGVRVLGATDHVERAVAASESLYFLDDLVPVPGRPEVAYVRWLYNDFAGVVVFDASTGEMRVAIPASGEIRPSVLAIEPDGRFVMP